MAVGGRSCWVKVWLGGKRTSDKKGWEWLDGSQCNYQNWYKSGGQPNNRTGYDCLVMQANKGLGGSGSWMKKSCARKNRFICDLSLEKTGNDTMTLNSSSLANQSLHFWWNSTKDFDSHGAKGFKLHWQIEHGNLPVKQLVSNDLEGNISTPGLGSLPPLNYYKERHEYTAVIEHHRYRW